MIPSKCFFTKGVGVHKHKLASFELALRDAGIAKYNLVEVSSILPPNCSIISKKEGLKHLSAGEITYVVLSRAQTAEPNRQIAAAVGLAVPKDRTGYGYLSEHHSYGESPKQAGDTAEDLAASMLATTQGINLDPEKAWNERKREYKASGKIFKSRHIVKASKGDKKGRWTTAIAAAVFLK